MRAISDLQSRILHDPYCMHRFVTSVAVCATSMFRDAGFYLAMRRTVIPLLRTYPFIRIWHAGCATGEEVYSMAILLEEEGIYDRCRLYATDLSDDLLDRAQAGIYPLDKIRNYTTNYHRAGGIERILGLLHGRSQERHPAPQPQAQHRVLAAQPGLGRGRSTSST